MLAAAVAGAVRKWKSSVAISKAPIYCAVFCTAIVEKVTREAFRFSGLERNNLGLNIYSYPSTSEPCSAISVSTSGSRVCPNISQCFHRMRMAAKVGVAR
jgi:hypothetical protein